MEHLLEVLKLLSGPLITLTGLLLHSIYQNRKLRTDGTIAANTARSQVDVKRLELEAADDDRFFHAFERERGEVIRLQGELLTARVETAQAQGQMMVYKALHEKCSCPSDMPR